MQELKRDKSNRGKLKIKKICLANGDEYNEVICVIYPSDFLNCLREGDIIVIEAQGKSIILNTEFVISIELY